MAGTAPSEDQKLSFEHAMERLENIVQEMETDQLPLEQLLARYEEGVRLVNLCSQRLENAGRRIQKITQDTTGKVKVEPFEEAAEEEE